jgi:hypothetical protein
MWIVSQLPEQQSALLVHDSNVSLMQQLPLPPESPRLHAKVQQSALLAHAAPT